MQINKLDLYNKEIKERFIETNYTNKNTQENYITTLKKASITENDYNKDIAEFNLNQLEDLARGFNCKTITALGKELSIIKRYMLWSQGQGYFLINNTIDIIFRSDLEKYINKIGFENQYVNREQMYDISNRFYNYIDKAIITLLFEGVRGRADKNHSFEEIRNLKPSDCKIIDNELILTRDNGEIRKISIPEKSMDIIIGAINETEYHKGNGEAKGILAIRPLKDTPYVIRTMERKGDEEKLIPSAVSSKFTTFKKYLDGDYNFINPTVVFQSGMLQMCADLENKRGELQPEDYKKIYIRYGLETNNWHYLKALYLQYKEVNNKQTLNTNS